MAKKESTTQEAHWRPVPAYPFDLPQEQQLQELRVALNVTRYNLAVAHDEFDRMWKHHEYVERQVNPHTFQEPREADRYNPAKCNLCFAERNDPRHGPVPPHVYVAPPVIPASVPVRRCLVCGGESDDPVHGPVPTRKATKPPPKSLSKAEHRRRDLDVALRRKK